MVTVTDILSCIMYFSSFLAAALAKDWDSGYGEVLTQSVDTFTLT